MKNPWYAAIPQTVGWMASMACLLSVAAFGQVNGDESHTLYSSFANGQTFYLQNDSFKPTGNGKLQYNVTSDTGNGGHRVSQNEIDCTTGQFKSPIESWQEDSRGGVSDTKAGPAVTMSLSQRTELYRTLKDACRQNLPEVETNW